MSAYVSEAMAENSFLSGAITRLRQRKLLIVTLAIWFFLILLVAIQLLPKSYRATASVTIEGQTPTAVQVGDVTRDQPFDEQTLGTELTILQSYSLLTEVVNRNGLQNKPEFNPHIHPSLRQRIMGTVSDAFSQWLPVPPNDVVVTPTEEAMSDTVDTLLKHLKLTPVPHSRVISIVVTASNNQLAAKIANTIADLYIATHREYKLQASRDARAFLDNRISELQRDADLKTRALEQYRISNGLTTAMTSTLVQEQLSGVSAQLQAASARLADLEGQSEIAKHSKPEELAAVLSSPTISKLRELEGPLAAQQARLLASYGPNSPVLAQTNAQLGSIRRQVADEARRAVASLPNQVGAARASYADLTRQLDTLRKQAQTTDSARVKLATMDDEAKAARTVYNDFLARLRGIDASMAYDATNVRIISHAVPPTRPSFPNYLIMLPAAFILSLGGAGTIGYLTARPKGIAATQEIQSLYDVLPLGMIPLRKGDAWTEQLFQSAIEQLLNRLYYLPNKPAPRSIMITSTVPQEGKTTTALALAEAAMRRGLNVFLVDADMRSSRVPRPRNSAPMLGLGDVLRGQAEIDVAEQKTPAGVRMLPAGSPRGNPTSLMALPKMRRVVEHLASSHDLVIVDAPPALIGGDCEMLSRIVDTTVLLARWRRTDPEEVTAALAQLDQTKVAGMVLTMVDPDKIMHYGSRADAVLYSKRFAQYYAHRS